MTLSVNTNYGKIVGLKETLKRGEISRFLGIPYCKSPIGDLRFSPPKEHTVFKKEFEAFSFSPISVQPPPDPNTSIPNDPYNISEDCLTLNIYVPGEPPNIEENSEKKAVMVWVHGGGFLTGATSWQMYEASNLALLGDVIVVTINYRLGILGFLGVETEDSVGNFGLLDQITALKWVKENIANFGGDEANITVFGESAGYMSVSTLAVIPQTKGLFNRAICESGAPMTLSLEESTEIKDKLLKILSLSDDRDLKNLSVEKILSAQNEISSEIGYNLSLPFMPIVDKKLITDEPIGLYKNNLANPIDLMMGTNRDEMLLFALGIPNLGELDFDKVKKLFNSTSFMMEAYFKKNPLDVLDEYERLLGKETEPIRLWSSVASDWVFRMPTLGVMDAYSQNVSNNNPKVCYLYQFEWVSSFLGGNLGACHALEVPFVFNRLDHPFIGLFAGADKPGAQDLADFVGKCWSSFAKTGIPDTEWEPYDKDDKHTMIIDSNSKCVRAPMAEFDELWT